MRNSPFPARSKKRGQKSGSQCITALPRTLADELEKLLAGNHLVTLLQPIVDTRRNQVFGYEALSRGPSDSPLHAAPILFETAERSQRTAALEALCLRNAAKTWAAHGLPQKLFVNVSPGRLLPPEFNSNQLRRLLRTQGIKPSDIVVELSERYPATDLAGLQKSLRELKESGFLIAIDDLGSGYSGLKLWAELKPDFVKIDRHFIRDIQDDLVKREFVHSVVGLAKRLDCTLIAEGVETEGELKVLDSLGINLVQGFLFGRPRPMPTAQLDKLKARAVSAPWQTPETTAESLGSMITPIAPDATLLDAWERLSQEASLFALPVVDGGRPLGLLHKWRLMELFSTPFGRALHEKRPVLKLVSTDSLVVEHSMPLAEVSQRLIDEDVHYLKQHFIITREGNYAGLGATRTLLQKITAIKIEKAIYANPLTQLPGNVPIYKSIASHAASRQRFSLAYFDINHFKPLNDVLGYRAGDQLILQLAELLSESFPAPESFVGHIGGDDFMVISTLPDIKEGAENVIDRFRQVSIVSYPAIDRSRGYVECADREGRPGQFPLASLAAGVVSVGADHNLTAEQLADLASIAKKKAKQTDGLWVTTAAGSLQLVKPAGTSAPPYQDSATVG